MGMEPAEFERAMRAVNDTMKVTHPHLYRDGNLVVVPESGLLDLGADVCSEGDDSMEAGA